jgi:hypothetical protein
MRKLTVRVLPRVAASMSETQYTVQVRAMEGRGRPAADGTLVELSADGGAFEPVIETRGGVGQTDLALSRPLSRGTVTARWADLSAVGDAIRLDGDSPPVLCDWQAVAVPHLASAPVASPQLRDVGLRITEGGSWARLHYRPRGGSTGEAIKLLIHEPIPGAPDRICVAFRGDGRCATLEARLVDADGGTFQYRLASIGDLDRHTAAIPVSRYGVAWGGDGRIDPPLRLESLLVSFGTVANGESRHIDIGPVSFRTYLPSPPTLSLVSNPTSDLTALATAYVVAPVPRRGLPWAADAEVLDARGKVCDRCRLALDLTSDRSAYCLDIPRAPTWPTPAFLRVIPERPAVGQPHTLCIPPVRYGEARLGPQNDERGLNQIDLPDGRTWARRQGSRSIRVPRATDIYFAADRLFEACARPAAVRLTVDAYVAVGPSAIDIEYDSADQGVTVVPEWPGAFKQVCAGSRLRAGWRRLDVVLPDAWFRRRCNGADFRVKVREGQLGIETVSAAVI